MMNQYKNETAQIHAPAALIERTKAAVREEENRIYRKRHPLRGWTYPLTVAAAVVILLSVSMAMRGIRSGDGEAASGSSMMTEESYGDTAADALESSPEEMNGISQADGVAAVVAEETESAEGAWEEAPAAEYAEEDIRDEMVQENQIQESAKAEKKSADDKDLMTDTAGVMEMDEEKFRSAKYGGVRIEAVEERPDFYYHPDAEDTVYEGQDYRIIKEENGWAAYVETEEGEAYVIRGEAKDLDAFLKEGYEELTKMSESR